MAFKSKTIKQIIWKSGGRCCFPDCMEQLVEDGTNVGEIAHITASSKGGPRYDESITEEERQSEANGCAMCLKHHTMIDSDESKYPKELIFQWKKDHEEWARNNHKGVDFIKTKLDEIEHLLNLGENQGAIQNLEFIEGMVEHQALSLRERYLYLKCESLIAEERLDEALSLAKNFLKKNQSNLVKLTLCRIEHQLGDDLSLRAFFEDLGEIPDENIFQLDCCLVLLLEEKYQELEQKINEIIFQDERMESRFLRIQALSFYQQEDYHSAEAFIDKALAKNPDSPRIFSTYIDLKTLILINKINQSGVTDYLLGEVDNLLTSISQYRERLSDKFHSRILFRLFINELRLKVAASKAVAYKKTDISKLIYYLKKCYWNSEIDLHLTMFLGMVGLKDEVFKEIVSTLRDKNIKVSDQLAEEILIKVLSDSKTLDENIEIFKDIKNDNCDELIQYVVEGDGDSFLKKIKDNERLVFILSIHLGADPNIRKTLIDNISATFDTHKKTVLFKYYFDQGDLSECLELFIKDKEYFYRKESVEDADLIVEGLVRAKAPELALEYLEKTIPKIKDPVYIIQAKKRLGELLMEVGEKDKSASVFKEVLESDVSKNVFSEDAIRRMFVFSIMNALDSNNTELAKEIHDKHLSLRSFPDDYLGISLKLSAELKDNDRFVATMIEGLSSESVKEEHFAQVGLMMLFNNSLRPDDYDIDVVEEGSYVQISNNEWYSMNTEYIYGCQKLVDKDEAFKNLLEKKVGDKVDIPALRYSSEDIHIKKISTLTGYFMHKSIELMNQHIALGKVEGIMTVKVQGEGEEFNLDNVIKLMEDQERPQREFFEKIYLENNLPIALLATSEGGIESAIGRIQNENKISYIHINGGSKDLLKIDYDNAKRIILGEEYVIDMLSALFLSETGLLSSVLDNTGIVHVSQTVIDKLRVIAEKFNPESEHKGTMSLSHDGRIVYSEVNKKIQKERYKDFNKSVELLEEKAVIHRKISNPLKKDDFIERKVLPECCDSYIIASEQRHVLLSDDFLYGEYNHKITGRDKPQTGSSLSLITLLYLFKKIKALDFLKYFSLLASYRCKHLHISSEMITKILHDVPEELLERSIYSFRLDLVLSDDYGITEPVRIGVVGDVLVRIVSSDFFSHEKAETVFTALIKSCSEIFSEESWENIMKFIYERISKETGTIEQKDKIDLLKKKLEQGNI